MKFSSILVAALAAVAEAKIAFTNSAFDVEAGKPFNLTWGGNVGPVTITLKNGPQTALKDVMVIDSSDSGTSFVWTPPPSLPSDVYAFQIVDSEGVPNYSVQFTFQGTASASITSDSSTSSSVTSTSSTMTTTTTESSTTTSTTSSSSQSSNSTSSHSSTGTSPTPTKAATTKPVNTNGGLSQKSPLALVLVTVVALLYFN